ncbi:MoxR family ATPase [Actinomycetota bacterium]|nr:MoxR family ATPase [Actinomycetota bacterium]
MSSASEIESPQQLVQELAKADYLADPGLATALFCALRLPQPLLLEGEAGVGKTQAAKALAQLLNTPLIRLQCFEGIDASEALYEWNYPRQLLSIRMAESRGTSIEESSLFSREFLIERPLLQALEHVGPNPAVLLIDEVDRADEEFEAFLFEMLAESTVSVPELGTLTAQQKPIVILTSNRTRDLHDALKRRCLYHWIDYPSLEHATQIVKLRAPEASKDLAEQVAAAVSRIRTLDMQKPPGVAEAIDWVNAAMLLGVSTLDASGTEQTLGSVLKYRDDQELAREQGLAWIAGE